MHMILHETCKIFSLGVAENMFDEASFRGVAYEPNPIKPNCRPVRIYIRQTLCRGEFAEQLAI